MRPVKISEEVYQKLDQYCESTGVPRVRVMEEALSDWLDTVGQARIEALSHLTMAKVITMPCTIEAQTANV